MNQFDESVLQEHIAIANYWYTEVMGEIGTSDRQRAQDTLHAVLRTIRDWLPPEKADALTQHLPIPVRNAYLEGWQPGAGPVRKQSKAEFLAHVAEACPQPLGDDVERVTRGVLQMLVNHIVEGQIANLKKTLPPDTLSLWPPS